MNVIRTRLRLEVAPDGTVRGQAPPTVPPGVVEAEIVRELRPAETDRGRLFAAVHALQAEVARMPVLDPRAPDEIIGYDEHGLPR